MKKIVIESQQYTVSDENYEKIMCIIKEDKNAKESSPVRVMVDKYYDYGDFMFGSRRGK